MGALAQALLSCYTASNQYEEKSYATVGSGAISEYGCRIA